MPGDMSVNGAKKVSRKRPVAKHFAERTHFPSLATFYQGPVEPGSKLENAAWVVPGGRHLANRAAQAAFASRGLIAEGDVRPSRETYRAAMHSSPRGPSFVHQNHHELV